MQDKKVLIALLTVVCFITLAGCGATPEPTKPPATSVPPTDTPIPPTPTPEVLKGTVDIWMWTGASDALEAYVPTYNEQFPDVEINVVLIPWDEQAPKYQAAMASGDVPDAFLIDDDQMHAFIESGGLMDLTEYIAPYRDDVAPFKMNFCTREDTIFCVPWDSGPMAMFYNVEIFDQVGIDVSTLKTWDDWTAAGEKILEATGGETVLVPMGKDQAASEFGLVTQIAWGLGSGVVDSDGKVIVENDDWVYGAKLVDDWWANGLIIDVPIFDAEWFAALSDGKAAAVNCAVWCATFLSSSIPEAEGKFRVAPWPGPPSNWGGASFIIPEGAEDWKLALHFLTSFVFSLEGNVAAYESQEIWPTYLPALSDPAFSQPNEFYGGQSIGEVFVEASKTIPPIQKTADFKESMAIVAKHYIRALDDEITPEEALSDAAAEIRLKTGRE